MRGKKNAAKKYRIAVHQGPLCPSLKLSRPAPKSPCIHFWCQRFKLRLKFSTLFWKHRATGCVIDITKRRLEGKKNKNDKASDNEIVPGKANSGVVQQKNTVTISYGYQKIPKDTKTTHFLPYNATLKCGRNLPSLESIKL